MLQQKTGFLHWDNGIEGLAGLAAEDGRAIRAVHLLAAAEAHRKAISFPRWGYLKARYTADLAYTRTLLDEEAWDVAWADGQAIAFDDVVRYALGDPASISEDSINEDSIKFVPA